MTNKIADNYPCSCGHSKINHYLGSFTYPKLGGTIEHILVCGVQRCDCDNFNGDNLKFLKKKYESGNPD